MATIEYWIQLENRPWDVSPHNIDRITGQDLKTITGKDPVDVTLTSPGTGASRTRRMFAPLRDSDGNVMDALILRRYKRPQKPDKSDAWTVSDDRKINPWDLNEPDPTDNGTMGTIPGPVIECGVGDSIVVHFRNMDNRTMPGIKNVCFPIPFVGEICLPVPTQVPLPIEKRAHSLHPHGFVFAATSDGAYPLSPPDPTQPIPASEAAAWGSVPGFTGQLKKGDRVPPGGTFDYLWNTFGWPTTAGVWLYHDHSICDEENVERGAIGIIVIHNREDPQDVNPLLTPPDPADPTKVDPALVPGGSPNGSPIETICFPFPPFPGGFPFKEVTALPHDLEGLGIEGATPEHEMRGMMGRGTSTHEKTGEAEPEIGPPVLERSVKRGNLLIEFDEKLALIRRLCISHYRTPPPKALYLQLFHTLSGAAGMCINGRTFLGNTPTMVAGPNTLMRFGVIAMGSEFHTFHIHGHRWIIPGPDGDNRNTAASPFPPGSIQQSPQVKAVSQFEDTKTFGPANSFVFTIQEGGRSFMGAFPGQAIGEWHMHCHVLSHMMIGMMGSLLIVNGGELAMALPVGVPCEMPKVGGGMPGGGGPVTKQVDAINDRSNPTGFSFSPATVTVNKNDTVLFKNISGDIHSVVWDTAGAPAGSPTISTTGPTSTWPVTMTTAGTFNYHCGVHGTNMKGTVIVNP